MRWRRILLGGVLAIGVVTAMFTWSVDRVETGDKDLPTQVKDYMKWHNINGCSPGYNSYFIANYKTKETVMMFSNNIDYWDLKEDSDYILHHYVGYRPELRF